jgi:hypothetical protein
MSVDILTSNPAKKRISKLNKLIKTLKEFESHNDSNTKKIKILIFSKHP